MNKFLRKRAKYDFNGWGVLPDYIAEQKLAKEMAPFIAARGESTDPYSDYATLKELAAKLQDSKLSQDEALGALINADQLTEEELDWRNSLGYSTSQKTRSAIMKNAVKDLISKYSKNPQFKVAMVEKLNNLLRERQSSMLENVKKGLAPSGIHYKDKEIPAERLAQAYKNITGKEYSKPGFLKKLFTDTRGTKDLPTALYYKYDPHYNVEKFSEDELAWLAQQANGKYLPRTKKSDAYYLDPLF